MEIKQSKGTQPVLRSPQKDSSSGREIVPGILDFCSAHRRTGLHAVARSCRARLLGAFVKKLPCSRSLVTTPVLLAARTPVSIVSMMYMILSLDLCDKPSWRFLWGKKHQRAFPLETRGFTSIKLHVSPCILALRFWYPDVGVCPKAGTVKSRETFFLYMHIYDQIPRLNENSGCVLLNWECMFFSWACSTK